MATNNIQLLALDHRVDDKKVECKMATVQR